MCPTPHPSHPRPLLRTARSFSLLAAALLLLPLAAAPAQSSKVSLTTKFVDMLPKPSNEQLREAREKKKKPGEAETEKEARQIAITARNVSRQTYPSAVATFYFFGRTAEEPVLQILEQEEKPMPIEAGATVTAESQTFKTT